jgi:uncharacterized membrane protein YfcA
MTPDQINACFEGFGSGAILLSVLKLLKDKQVHGISYWQVLFFTGWGYFNLYYYDILDQQFSWYAGMCVTVINTIYFGLLIYYDKIKSRNRT